MVKTEIKLKLINRFIFGDTDSYIKEDKSIKENLTLVWQQLSSKYNRLSKVKFVPKELQGKKLTAKVLLKAVRITIKKREEEKLAKSEMAK
jgi:hypothetical protein